MCLEYHIGNCMGPCVGKQTEEAYNDSIAAIRHVLKGNLGSEKRVEGVDDGGRERSAL